MNRNEKIALLTQVLQGKTERLHTFKQEQRQTLFVFIVDEVPKDWFGSPETNDTPVKTKYQLKDKTYKTEYLTHAQMREKAKGGVLLIIPNNHRRRLPTSEQ